MLSPGLTNYHAMKTYPLLNKEQREKMYWGSGSIAPHITDLGTRLEWMVSLHSLTPILNNFALEAAMFNKQTQKRQMFILICSASTILQSK